MTKVFQLVSAEPGAGLMTTALGVKHLFQQHGLNAGIFWPVGTPNDSMVDLEPVYGLEAFNRAVQEQRLYEVLETLAGRFDSLSELHDVICIIGLSEAANLPQAREFNTLLAKSLNSQVIVVCSGAGTNASLISSRIKLSLKSYHSINDRILGFVLNKIGVPLDRHGRIRPDLGVSLDSEGKDYSGGLKAEDLKRLPVPMLGFVPWDQVNNRARVSDLSSICEFDYLNEGEASTRRISWLLVATRSVDTLTKNLKANTLIVTAGDRVDVLMMAALAEQRGVKLAGLLLTSGIQPSQQSVDLIQMALDSGLPVLETRERTYEVVSNFSSLFLDVPNQDEDRFVALTNHVAAHLNRDALLQLTERKYKTQLSPAAFRYKLVKRAAKLNKTIVLPEGDEPRTLEAAQLCCERNIAKCVLLGDPEKIRAQLKALDIEQHQNLQIIDPLEAFHQYVDTFVALREHKGMNPSLATDILREDRIMLGTLMLYCGDVDGLVAGAENTTAATVTPAFQIIKTQPGQSLVSSCFFMCLPDQVLVYADCAINPDPTSEQLADIAVQSAASAQAFGIEPRVAMISYSTGSSGSGSDVDKVIAATQTAKAKLPDVLIDGPLQYDAASVANVAKSKALTSTVAGQATVFIFPDLNTGNTTYKAVQRSAGVISIGPMLQGLNKPVNDLSRGALVNDIVYTIALTCIQAGAN
ncbi:MAG: phosphate acetyltransferase [Pseudomonadales bacterium]|jgi:phosphate acetyltransferase